jgi:hypothetical protein
MQEVFANHPGDYLPLDGWQENASKVLKDMLPRAWLPYWMNFSRPA